MVVKWLIFEKTLHRLRHFFSLNSVRGQKTHLSTDFLLLTLLNATCTQQTFVSLYSQCRTAMAQIDFVSSETRECMDVLVYMTTYFLYNFVLR